MSLRTCATWYFSALGGSVPAGPETHPGPLRAQAAPGGRNTPRGRNTPGGSPRRRGSPPDGEIPGKLAAAIRPPRAHKQGQKHTQGHSGRKRPQGQKHTQVNTLVRDYLSGRGSRAGQKCNRIKDMTSRLHPSQEHGEIIIMIFFWY